MPVCLVVIAIASTAYLVDRRDFIETDKACKKLGYTIALDSEWCVKLDGRVNIYQRLSTLERISSLHYP